MLRSIDNLLRFGASRLHTAGWSSSLAIHLLGAAVVSCLGAMSLEVPYLPGRQGIARLELTATWMQPEPPAEIPIAVDISRPRHVNLPDPAHVVERVQRKLPTDVARPAGAELPSTELRAAIPRAPSRRRVARLEENPAPAPTASPPRVAPRLTPAEIPSAEVCIVSAATWSPSIGTQGQTMPKLLSNPPPIYPVEAVRDGWEGTVLLRLYVNADGSVARVEVISSSEHGILDAAAVDGVGNWHFEPARRFGHPVACTVCQPVRFSLP